MDFFGAQEAARRATAALVGLVALAVALIVLTVYAAAVAALGAPAWDPGLLVVVVLLVGGVVVGGSLVRSAQLRAGGGRAVAEGLGGRQVPPDTEEPADRRLLNVVEEMAIASGVPVPAVYVLDDEPAINAFAAGYGPEDAVVAVTRGARDRLSRAELQGVVAHEFSHILNRDIRLNIRLTGLVFGLLALGLAGRALLQAGRFGGSRRDARAVAVAVGLGLLLLVLGYAGVFFGRIVQAAVSRQREFLADAAAVQFTRDPHGLAGALRKIAEQGSALRTPAAEEVCHMFFARGLRRGLTGWVWATHPPLGERIRRLEGGASSGEVAPAGPPLLHEVPPVLRESAHNPLGAVALTYALFAVGREGREESLAARLEPSVEAEVRRVLPALRAVPETVRLAVLDLAAPAHHELSDAQAAALARDLAEAVRAEPDADLFDLALEATVRFRLARTHGEAAPGRPRPLEQVVPDVAVLLSALALGGHPSPSAARAAFAAGMARLTRDTAEPVPPTPEDVRAALLRCAEASPEAREAILEACVRTARHDRRLEPAEAHLLRAVAAALGLPAPPFLPGVA